MTRRPATSALSAVRLSLRIPRPRRTASSAGTTPARRARPVAPATPARGAAARVRASSAHGAASGSAVPSPARLVPGPARERGPGRNQSPRRRRGPARNRASGQSRSPRPEHEPSVSASSSLTSWSAVPAAPPGPVTRVPSGPPESLFPAISPPDPPASPWDQPRLHSSPAGLSAAVPTAPRAAPADPASPVRSGPVRPDPVGPDPGPPRPAFPPEEPGFRDWFSTPEPAAAEPPVRALSRLPG